MAIISIVASSQGHEDDIYTIELNKDNFDTEIKEKSYFVMFFAPWWVHFRNCDYFLYGIG